MFRLPFVAVFREVFLKDVLHRTLNSLQIRQGKFYVKGLKCILRYRVLIKLFVLNCVFEYFVCVCVCVCMYVYMYVFCVCVCMYVYVYVYVCILCVCIYICMYIYIYTHTHTHTHKIFKHTIQHKQFYQ